MRIKLNNIDNRNRLNHIIHFFDETTLNSKAKPESVKACEIWMKIGGTPPVPIYRDKLRQGVPEGEAGASFIEIYTHVNPKSIQNIKTLFNELDNECIIFIFA